TSHSRIERSSFLSSSSQRASAEASLRPSGEKASDETCLESTLEPRLRSNRPVAASQSLIVESPYPDAITPPSGENATACCTDLGKWLSTVLPSRPVSMSQSLTDLSLPATKVRPSGAIASEVMNSPSDPKDRSTLPEEMSQILSRPLK